ncbi:uncharacterized protein LOC133199634 isoform X2 [Saccostrea echinata]|uniref:uncharacterized protein LOC133199634 isoform X2 n=1 Tax=Saccostrea echinata TaxID=191078 RepID=UPI002A8325A6|nr:uncharacterized protein LOC133199634 isoform X2 [Saccostrea echinata]
MPPKQAGKTPRKRRKIQSPGITLVEPTTSVPTLPQNNGTGEPFDGAHGATHQTTSLEPRPAVTQVSNQVSIDYAELAKQILVQQQNLGTHTASQPLPLNQATTALPPAALIPSHPNGHTVPALSTEKSSVALAASSASQPLPLNQATTVLSPEALTPSQPNGQTAPALSTEKSSAAASSFTSLLDTVFADPSVSLRQVGINIVIKEIE